MVLTIVINVSGVVEFLAGVCKISEYEKIVLLSIIMVSTFMFGCLPWKRFTLNQYSILNYIL